ncbi:hypothetical protein [Ralstonia solanacearum]|uniref:hypothetical protein n=1 Tax=Ralstonia solanacearum TaxID=305 RepID=UPI000F61482C|nr:hypothetical protein [Ralstonia solanacearum]MCL9844085.1 hypothetical protein [Ralstonia solanacearum]MDC6256543.1 hypothetical protein [Ralstonia solanacearum]MDC6261243.1 hypothetical protein [Ralstonia solanacearum]MDC6305910.1 hypothetical protein [Ralstonia solanacearum]
MSQTTELELPPITTADVVRGYVRLAKLVVDASGESFAIAVLGEYESGQAFARAVTSRALRCLPHELGYACHTFGNLLVADYMAWSESGKKPEAWRPPLGDIVLGPAFVVEAEKSEDVVASALERCALYPGNSAQQRHEDEGVTGRPTDEARFAKSVMDEVLSVSPSLASGFNKKFSLTGSASGFTIDFIGHTYATCYAAINPKSKTSVRLKAASAGLWRLARARDAFGFASPDHIELTAWVPAPGLPIYSDSEYVIVRDTIDELEAQAKREDLRIFSTYDSHKASSRLLHEEVIVLN